MPRPRTEPPQPRRDALLAGAIDYVAGHGLADLSLRPLAAALGTSARMLVFHFASKEGLLRALLAHAHERLQALLRELPPGPGAPLQRFWRHATGSEPMRLLRILYEAQILAAQNPPAYAHLRDGDPRAWVRLVAARLPAPFANATGATLVIAVFDGLMLERMATGDHRRTTRALDRFTRLLQEASR